MNREAALAPESARITPQHNLLKLACPDPRFPKMSRQSEHPVVREASVSSNNSSGPSQPAPEPRAPAFECYPPAADAASGLEWAADADSRRLQGLWQSVNADDGRPLVGRPGCLVFLTALTRALELEGEGSDGRASAGEQAAVVRRQKTGHADLVGDEAGAGAGVVAPALPGGVIRGLAEVVLSASICSCGREMTAEEGGGCSTHGFSAVSWARILPTGNGRGGGETVSGGGGERFGVPSGGTWLDGETDAYAGSSGAETGQHRARGAGGADGGEASQSSGETGIAARRACLVAALRALTAACRLPRGGAREELARQCRGGRGGLAKGLASLCDALCARVTELKRRQQGPFRRPYVVESAEAGR